MIGKILVRAPTALKAIVVNESKKMGISLNALILSILWAWAKKHETESEKK
ncbi:MAG: hypothetical protein LBQ27_00475 [Clostridiales bacterium]|jgi:predicted HicB family RNase H-like nuclease|nr:hypothetical protein [Clostridiales bacterium]